MEDHLRKTHIMEERKKLQWKNWPCASKCVQDRTSKSSDKKKNTTNKWWFAAKYRPKKTQSTNNTTITSWKIRKIAEGVKKPSGSERKRTRNAKKRLGEEGNRDIPEASQQITIITCPSHARATWYAPKFPPKPNIIKLSQKNPTKRMNNSTTKRKYHYFRWIRWRQSNSKGLVQRGTTSLWRIAENANSHEVLQHRRRVSWITTVAQSHHKPYPSPLLNITHLII